MNHLQQFTNITGEIDALYHEAAFLLGQSDSTMTVLYTVRANGGQCSISDICRLSGIRKQTLNSALRKMEQEGLIALEADGAKAKTVVFTKEGAERAEQTAGRLQAMEDNALADWTPEEVEQYLALSNRFLSRFREQVAKL